jgi:hypothetical protein
MGVAPQIIKKIVLVWSNLDPIIKVTCARILNELNLKIIIEERRRIAFKSLVGFLVSQRD